MIEDDSGANKSEEREMIRKTWWAMDTEISLYLPRRHLSLFPIVLNLFKRNEQRFSRFITESELMRLNQSSSAWVRVSIPLFRLLFLAHHYWEQTKGLFSPYEYEALVAAGYDRSFPLLSEENVRFHHAKEETVVDPKSRDGVPLLLDRHRLRVKKAKGIKIDLGGIAKSWTVMEAVRFLKEEGVEQGALNAGGDFYVWHTRQSIEFCRGGVWR